MQKRILIVDDDRSMCELIEADVRQRGFEPVWRTRADEALATLQERNFDVVLTDLKLPGMDGIQLCERIGGSRPDIPVIVITAFGSMERAIEAIRAGAYDFVTKPVEMELLALTLDRAVRHRAAQEQVRILSRAVEEYRQFEELLGDSDTMRSLYDELARISDSESSVLISGESGTGKELVARALHARSRRKDRPFVAVNCAALPEALLESELFGHVRGAFTDARTARKGLFFQADGGTLFLDEIGDFPIALQPKLLRALEERAARPVGGDQETAFDVRLVAATNHDLDSAVNEQRFREDLFFRINVIQVEIPPLRARGTDVLLLAQRFVDRCAARATKEVTGISDTAAEKLLAYSWPGNVRELQNAIERAVALTRLEKITVEDLPEKIRAYRRSEIVLSSDNPHDLAPLHEVERRYILHILRAVGGSKTLAARVLGLDRKTLYRKLHRYGKTDEIPS